MRNELRPRAPDVTPRVDADAVQRLALRALPIALLFMMPFVQMLLASLSPADELVAFPPPFIPSRLTLDGFAGLFTDTAILRWLLNSTIVSVIAIVAHVVLCSLAGYGFARLQFRGPQLRASCDHGDHHDPDPAADDPDLHHVLRLGLDRHLARRSCPGWPPHSASF